MNRLGIVVLAAAMAAAAVGAGANTLVRRHHPLHRHIRYAHRRHLSVEMRADDVGGGSAMAARPRPAGAQAWLKPDLQTRIGRRGATASFGYHPGAVGPTLQPHELDGAADTQLGRSESVAGVQVKVPL
ncbi:MAG TPA: hypothetical protein VIC25_09570 [Caulobacteraceae bacterium]